MQLPIECLPAQGRPEQLILLLHAAGADARSMRPLVNALRAEFAQAAVLVPDAPLAAEDGGPGRQWFSLAGIADADDDDDEARVLRVGAALPALQAWVRQTQQRLQVGPAATAIAGLSQGAMLALECAVAADGLAGRVLAFGGRFARLPATAPRHTTVHLFHGGADAVIDAAHSRAALQHLAALRGDATLDIAEGVGAELHPVLLDRALFRLRNHIPARTWAAALGAVPGLPPHDAGPHDAGPHESDSHGVGPHDANGHES